MAQMSRRTVLKLEAAAGGATIIAACAPAATTAGPSAAPRPRLLTWGAAAPAERTNPQQST